VEAEMKKMCLTLCFVACCMANESAAAPTIIKTLDIPWASGLCVDGSYAYVTGTAITKVDVSNPSSPVIAGSYPVSYAVNDIFVSGNTAYLAADTSGMLVMDISSITSPALMGSIGIEHRAESIFLSNSYAYVTAWGDSDLYVINIASPSAPTYVTSAVFSWDPFVRGIHVTGHKAYIADLTGGLVVLDISDPLQFVLSAYIDKKGTQCADPYSFDSLFPNGVFFSNPYAFVADQNGLQIINISDYQSPVLAGSVDLDGGATDVHVSGSYAYVTGSPVKGKLHVIDVSEYIGQTAVSAKPSVNVSINGSRFSPGDKLTVSLTTQPGTDNDGWDLYVGLIMPDGTLLFMAYDPALTFSTVPLPARPSGPITPATTTILDITLPQGLPEGGWYWASAFGKNNLGTLSDISLAAMTIANPEPPPADLSGNWNIQETTTGNCPGDDYPFTGHYLGSLIQTGNGLTVTYSPGGYTLNGTISSNTVSFSGTFPRSGGTVTTSFTGTASPDGLTISGTASWTWSDGEVNCSGTTTVAMTKVVAAIINVAGLWNGTWTSSAYGLNGTFSANITQQNATLGGTISVPDIGMFNAGLKGSVNDNNMTFGDIGDQITFIGAISGNSYATGTYSYPSMEDSGSWEGSRD
jgi:hypothetical protein